MTSKLTITDDCISTEMLKRLIRRSEDGDRYVLAALRELQERRKSELDSEPVAWTDEEELRDVNVAGIGYLFGIDREANKFADPRRQIMLYRHGQPAPVVNEGLYKLANHIASSKNGLPDEWQDWADELETDIRRAAMLQEEKASNKIMIMPLYGASYPIGIAPMALFRPSVTPDGYVMVPVDLLSELRDWAHPEIEKYCEMWKGRRDSEFPALRKVIADADALLAAAQQEAKGE